MKCLSLMLLLISIAAVTNAHAGVQSFKSDDTYNKKRETPKQHMGEYQITAETLLESLGRELKDLSYTQEILPSNFSHCISLLHYGQKTQQTRDYSQSVLRLFGNLLKGSDWINAYAFSHQFLANLPEYLGESFIPYKIQKFVDKKMLFDLEMVDRLQSSINGMLFTSFNKDYDIFKKDPTRFLDGISFQISELAHEELTIDQLRQSLIRFLEICMNKLVWTPHDKEKTWDLVKTISEQLSKMVEKNMIGSVNDLDDLSWSLVHRYCYFLDLASTDLPVEFYDKIKHDIAKESLAFLNIEEQEPFIESKSQKLLRTVITNQAKRIAYTAKDTKKV